jgi:hypothetical protein
MRSHPMLAGLFLPRMDHCNFWLKKALDGKTLILYGAASGS